MSKRTVAAGLLCLPLILTAQLTPARTSGPAAAPAATFTNPILRNGADPWVIRHDGYYYLMCTTGGSLVIWKSRTLQGMSSAKRVTVWRPPASGPESREVWAPELHWINHRWYVYYAADDGRDAHHRIYVLESLTKDPQGAYRERGKVADSTDRWAIDPTVLHGRHGKLYLVWSGWPGDRGPQDIYIARLSNPWTITGPRVMLSSPTYRWETHGWRVNEGPEILEHRGKIFLIYSASGGSTPDYCLGMLEHDRGDVLDATTWVKSPTPVFQRYSGQDGDVYGPGHCSFTKSPDGKTDWIVYHARDFPQDSWSGRSTRTQPVAWEPDGVPDFGHPIPDGVPLPCPR